MRFQLQQDDHRDKARVISGLGKASTVSMEDGIFVFVLSQAKVLEGELRDATYVKAMIGLRDVALLLGCHKPSR
jgi:hypothetical protein